jgi:transposase
MERYKDYSQVAEEVWVGIDLHRVQWHVTVRVEGAELFSGSIAGSWESLHKLLERYCAKHIFVVYEAGYFGFWLHDKLTQWGASCTVTPPNLVPQEPGNHVKTDRRDSRRLAFLLMKGLLKSVWVPSTEQCTHRDVLRRRHKLMQDRVRVQSRIKTQLQMYGIQIEVPTGFWSQRYFRTGADSRVFSSGTIEQIDVIAHIPLCRNYGMRDDRSFTGVTISTRFLGYFFLGKK